MKTIKNLFAIILISTILISCKEAKKGEHSESIESIETAEGKEVKKSEEKNEEKRIKKEHSENINSLEAVEVEEVAEFNYIVYYPKDTELAGEVDSTIKSLIANQPGLESDFINAYACAIFPKITKAAFGLVGAGGNGLVLENDHVIG
jgi:hypothetical protein